MVAGPQHRQGQRTKTTDDCQDSHGGTGIVSDEQVSVAQENQLMFILLVCPQPVGAIKYNLLTARFQPNIMTYPAYLMLACADQLTCHGQICSTEENKGSVHFK